LFEKKDKQFVEADLAVVVETGGRPRLVAHVLHTAIYCLAPPRVDSPQPAC
jgi:hypothetical protein